MSIIDVTGRCNLKCVYCCRGDLSNPASDPSEEEVIRSVQQVIRNRGTFAVIQGGEPLVRKNIDRLFRRMGELKEIQPGFMFQRILEIITKGFPTSEFRKQWMRTLIEQGLPLYCLTTNGMRYSKEIDEALYDSGFYVEISLDSADAKVNERSRPGIRFDRVIQNTRKYAKRNPVELSCTVTEHNVEELSDMLHLTKELGCVCLKITPVQQIGLQVQHEPVWIERYFLSMHRVLDLFTNFNTSFFMKIKLDGPLLSTQPGQALRERIESCQNILLEEKLSCSAYHHVKDLYIDPFGNVYGCASFNGQKDWIMGNINQMDLREIWNSERRWELRTRALEISSGSADEGNPKYYDYDLCPATVCAEESLLQIIAD